MIATDDLFLHAKYPQYADCISQARKLKEKAESLGSYKCQNNTKKCSLFEISRNRANTTCQNKRKALRKALHGPSFRVIFFMLCQLAFRVCQHLSRCWGSCTASVAPAPEPASLTPRYVRWCSANRRACSSLRSMGLGFRVRGCSKILWFRGFTTIKPQAVRLFIFQASSCAICR